MKSGDKLALAGNLLIEICSERQSNPDINFPFNMSTQIFNNFIQRPSFLHGSIKFVIL